MCSDNGNQSEEESIRGSNCRAICKACQDLLVERNRTALARNSGIQIPPQFVFGVLIGQMMVDTDGDRKKMGMFYDALSHCNHFLCHNSS